MKNNKYYKFLGNLANPLRIQIIECLRDKEKSVSEISKELKVEQSKLSHALLSMKCCSIVESRQDGKKRIYSLNKNTIVPILKIIEKHANKYCNGSCSCCA